MLITREFLKRQAQEPNQNGVADQTIQHSRFSSTLNKMNAKVGIKKCRIMNTNKRSRVRALETYDIAEGDDVEESGGALAGGGVLIDILVGEDGSGLQHRFREVGELLHCLHGSLTTEISVGIGGDFESEGIRRGSWKCEESMIS